MYVLYISKIWDIDIYDVVFVLYIDIINNGVENVILNLMRI